MSRLVFYIVLIAIAVGLTQCSPGQDRQDINIPYDSIQEGDLVFRRGEGIVSNLVVYNDANGRYSHVGVVVKCDTSLLVVHSVPGEGADKLDRVRAVTLQDFFSNDHALIGEVMRVPLDSVQLCELSCRAMDKAEQKVAFDHNYDLEDTTKLYCTELIQLLFSNIGVDLAQGRSTHIGIPAFTGDYIMPSDIYQNSDLKSIFIF